MGENGCKANPRRSGSRWKYHSNITVKISHILFLGYPNHISFEGFILDYMCSEIDQSETSINEIPPTQK